MDQDFHYYGTYYAAKTGGFNKDDATLIAKAANFIDFFNETTYAAYWKLVSNTAKSSNYNVVASMDYPRYTFQGGFLSTGLAPEDGLWCSYHFTPGNYDEPPNTPSREAVHGQDVASFLPKFQKRDTTKGMAELRKYPARQAAQYMADLKYGNLLNRPQSALSRELIMDAIACATDDGRLRSILGYALGGQNILQNNASENLRRFKLILLGIRAHVVADTWAHQDFCGIGNVLNTYWDVNYDPKSWDPSKWGYGLQSIDYNDGTSGWKNIVLSSTYKTSITNFEAVPTDTSYLGHGWMGHLPDFSFVKFRYKPCWSDPAAGPIERNNPQEYQSAWVELVSLFNQARGSGHLKLTDQFKSDLNKANSAIQSPCSLAGSSTGRRSSANAWKNVFGDLPSTNIDVDLEPDSQAVLDGMIEATTRADRYGTDYVNVSSDLYLFQIAADYHFHFVKDYLERHGIYRFTGSWSQQRSALAPDVSNLFKNPAVPNNVLPLNTPLNVGESLVSKNRQFFAIMQSDGNLCVYRGTPGNQGPYMWGSQATAGGGAFFTIVQGDGNLCTYFGTPNQQGAYLWGSQALGDGGQFFLVMQDDGNLCVYKGSSTNQGAFVWGSMNSHALAEA